MNRFTKAARTILGRDKPQPVELGATGTVIFSGQLIDTEYLTELQGEKGFKVYDKMRRSDGQVKAGLLACKLPLLVAHWDVQPGGDSAQDQQIAQALRDNLFEGMSITWDDFLRHTLIMLDFGFMVFEKVWELRDGLYVWRKLAPRLPQTVRKWFVDDEGGLAGIEQWTWKQDKYEIITIPVEKLLVFTNEREGSNFAGTSILRAAYKHWYYKNNLYAIDGIAAERHGVGLAKFSYPGTASTDQKAAIEAMGERLHAHERAYIALPEEVKFDLMGVAGQLHDIKGSIEHHDLQIVRSILAQFINLGSKDVGSFALSADQSGFFLMALQAVGRYICDTMNRYAIKQMVDYNWSVQGRYPKLTVSGLEHYDIAAYSTAISQLVTVGALLPDEEIEAELRRVLKLPVKKAGAKAEIEQARDPRYNTIDDAKKLAKNRLQGSAGISGVKGQAGFKWLRPFRDVEKHVAFAEIRDKLDNAEQAFIDAVAPIQKKQIAKAVDIIAGYIEDGEYDRMTEIDIPYRDKVADVIDDLLVGIMDYGSEQVRREYQSQQKGLKGAEVPLPKPPDRRAFLRIRALSIANILANKLRAALAWGALHQIKEGVLNKEGLVSVLTGLSDRDLRSTASASAVEAFNMGREEQAQSIKDKVDRVQSSAILDTETCGYCQGLDGQEWLFGQTPFEEPPYKDCGEGYGKCRCVWVYIFKTER